MTKSTLRGARLLYLLAIIKLLILIDFMMLMPLGPALMRDLGVKPREFGPLVSAYTVASAFTGLLGSRLLDRYPRRPLVAALLTVFAGATIATGLGHEVWALFLGRVIAGGAAGLLWSLVMTVLMDAYPPRERGRALGVVMGAYSAAAVVGVPLGLVLASWGSWRVPFLSVGALALALCVVAGRTLPHSSPTRDGSVAVGALHPRLMRGWGLTFMVVFTGFLLIPYLGTFLSDNLGFSPRQLALVYGVGGAVSFFSARLIGHVVDRWDARWVLTCLIVASAIPHVLFARQTSSALVLVVPLFVAFMVFTSGRVIPTLELITRDVPPQVRGRFLSINTSVGDLASGLAAFLAARHLAVDANGALVGLDRLGIVAACAGGVTLVVLHGVLRPAAAPRGEEVRQAT